MPVVVVMLAKLTGVSLANPCAVRVTVSPASWNVTATASDTPVPNTSCPATKSSVLEMVTVVLPAVVPLDALENVNAPKLLVTVMVCCVGTVGRLVNISSSAATDSLQDATLKVKRKFLASIRARLEHELNMVLKFTLLVTVVVTSSGMFCRLEQD